MLKQEQPEDYVIASGETHSIRELVELAFRYADMEWKDYVVIDPDLYRPAEIYELKGDFSKAREKFGWRPKVTFTELIQRMVDADLKALKET